jgi:outer membrane PBP1 activator LpoA protein
MAIKNHINRLSVPRILTPVALAIVLAACSSTPSSTKTVDITGGPIKPADTYLKQADNSTGVEQNDLYIMALKAAVKENNVARANLLLIRLAKQNLNESQLAEWQLARARLLLNRNQDDAALKQFTFAPWWKLPDAQWHSFYRTRADIFTGLNRWLEASRALIEVYGLSNDADKPLIAQEIWNDLNHYSVEQIAQMNIAPDEDELAGWLELVTFMKDQDGDRSQLKAKIEQWQLDHSDHPAARHLPKSIEDLLALKVTTSVHTALLLPLTGQYAQQAQLIKDGYLFAMANDANRSRDTTLAIIDTQSQSMSNIATQLSQANIDFIVGPLIKEDINALKQAQIAGGKDPLPMLALNIPENITAKTNTCYIALSPEQEIAQAARHLHDEGFRYPLIITPYQSYGNRVIEAFKQEWAKENSTPVAVTQYRDKRQLQNTINTAFGLQGSQQNIAQVESMMGTQLESQPRSRRDIDVVYIAADSADLTLIKPFIEVAINPGTKPPKLYSSSRSNSGKKQYEDLGGVSYSDIPLLVNPKASIKAQMDQLWPRESNTEIRFKALGMDAYQLVTQLPQMQAIPDYQIQGQSGKLSIDDRCIVQRELDWGEYDSL